MPRPLLSSIPTIFFAAAILSNPTFAGKGGRPVVEPEASSVVRSFTHAIEGKHWGLALSLCHPSVQKEAVKYNSAEAFLKEVVPLPEILGKAGVCSYVPKRSYQYFVRLGPDPKEQSASWEWAVRTIKDGDWRIFFPTVPIAEWRRDELAYLQYEKEWSVGAEREAAKIRPFVKTVLSTTDTVYEIGRPIWLKLVVENHSGAPLHFENSQATLNGSMTVTRDNGDDIPYSDSVYQTGANPWDLPPHQTRVVFDQMDLGSKYPMREPGTYHVQFNGGGLHVWIEMPFSSPVERPSVAYWIDRAASGLPETESSRTYMLADKILSNSLTVKLR